MQRKHTRWVISPQPPHIFNGLFSRWTCLPVFSSSTYEARTLTVWEPPVSVAASVICLSSIRSRRLSEIGVKFRHLYRKFGLPSKNMMSGFALELAKYPQNSPKLQNSVRACCLGSVSDAACCGRDAQDSGTGVLLVRCYTLLCTQLSCPLCTVY